jgi:hypothetical protein
MLQRDLDHDGSPELFAILTDAGEPLPHLVAVVLKRDPQGWALLHLRESGRRNRSRPRFLRRFRAEFASILFEARYQCDDERPESYMLFWDAELRGVRTEVPGQDLHPFERDWDCGE